MTLPTCNVLCSIYDDAGVPIAEATITARLNQYEVYLGYVVPQLITGKTNANGQVTLALWPNQLGSTESMYVVKIFPPNGKSLTVNAVVPNVASTELHLVAELPAYTGKTDGQLILDAAVAAGAIAVSKAAEAATSATNAATSATNAATSASTATTQANAAGASATTASTAATTATTQAGTASTAATTASTAATTATTQAGTASTAATTASTASTTATTQAGIASSAATAASSSATAASGSATTATTQATNSANSAAASGASASAASTSAATASTAATTATTQAGLAASSAAGVASAVSSATAQAAAAASSAGIANTQAGIASSAATTATTQANLASYYAGGASTSATAAASSATAAAASANSVLSVFNSTAALDAAVATAVAQVPLATAQANSAASSAMTAQSQSSLAQGYAASAASVVTQDLSGVTAAALHRSPNAVSAMFVYDTSKDSDGGAWTEKCQNTSWYNEPLSGNWLGSASNELAARCTNATLGTDVTNGGFDTDTVWTKGTGWVISNGVASIASGTSPLITQNAPQTLALGDIVKVTFTLLSLATGKAYIIVAGNETNSGSEQFYTPGTYTRYVTVSTLTNQTVGILVGNSPTGISIDNVSFRKITSINTATGDYFQLTTDGKFYRLWKNWFSYSQAINSSNYNSSAGTFIENSIAAPDGTLTATKCVLNNGATFAWFGKYSKQTVSVVAGVAYTISLYLKPAEKNVIVLTGDIRDGGGLIDSATFTLTGSGSVTTTAGATATITTESNGWYRCAVTMKSDNTSFEEPGWSVAYTGNGVDGFYVWGFQFELGSIVTTYEAKTTAESISEVFRGNKAKFPKLVGIVAEASSVTLYDLTESSRPMFARIAYQSGAAGFLQSATTNGLYVQNAKLAITGGGGSGLVALDFAKDTATIYLVAATYTHRGSIAQRNSTLGYQVTGASALPSNTTNAVAMTVLPDAPVDPVTGLQVPTIWVCTAGGLSVIQQNGIVVSNTNGAATGISVISPSMVQIVAVSGSAYHGYAKILQGVLTIFGQSSSWIATALPKVTNANNSTARLSSGQKQQVAIGFGLDPSNVAVVTRLNASNPLQNISTYISSLSNTGYMLGDIRRAYLADSVVESVSSAGELVTNGTFNSDVSSWTASGATAVWNSDGTMTVTSSTAGSYNHGVYQAITTVIGKLYVVQLSGTSSSTNSWYGVGNSAFSASIVALTSLSANARASFVATSTTTFISLMPWFTGNTITVDNISCKLGVADRSYKGSGALIYGTLTKALTNTANQVVAYSGFSTANYLQEPYSADLDFGTGEWSVSAWVNAPVVLPVSSFPVIGSERITNGNFASSGATWTVTGADATHIATFSAGSLRYQSDSFSPVLNLAQGAAFEQNKSYKVSITASAASAGAYLGFDINGSFKNVQIFVGVNEIVVFSGVNTILNLYRGTANMDVTLTGISVKEVGASIIAERSAASGPSIKLGITSGGLLVATAYDGTITRTVITTAAYNNATLLKASAIYKTDGSLAITVNGVQVATTYGNPLLTLTNSNAVLTIGNSYALDAPFPGSIAQLKLSATAPTAEQSVFMYEQEKQMFRDGAQSLLPDSGAVVDLAYDDVTDKWIAASATYESSWTGLVRTGVTAVPAGSNIKVQATSGVKLNARSATSPGVDVTLPAYNLKEEIVKRGEAAAKLSRITSSFDYVGGFTATTVVGNTAVTAVLGLVYPSTVNLRGCVVTGTGIPASTTIVDIVGTTIYLSAKATAAGTLVQVSLTDFPLPVGYEAKTVLIGGTGKIEGSTKDYVRLYDGFKETIRFSTAPGYTASIQLQAIRSAT